MRPRCSVDSIQTPTQADIDFIAQHPEYVERLQQFLRANGLDSVENLSKGHFNDVAELLLVYDKRDSGGISELQVDQAEQEVSARWSPNATLVRLDPPLTLNSRPVSLLNFL